MKVFLFNLFFLLSFISFQGQTKSIYVNPDFESLAKDHKKLAVIPFVATVKLRPRQMKKMTSEQHSQLELNEGKSIQNALESYFLKKQSRGDFRVSFQGIKKTNSILIKNNIDISNIDSYSSEELAKILGVDGIISGTLDTNKPMSDGASLALGLLVGFYGSTNSGTCVINIHDGVTGGLLWKYRKTLSRSLGSDNNTIISAMMRKSSRKFPYKKLK